MIRYGFVPAALVAALTASGPMPLAAPPEKADAPAANKNTLLTKHKEKLALSASTTWNGWPVERLIDGKADTSWFSAANDTTTKGTTPWVEVTFPEDVTVNRVTILSNREPPYEKGFAVLLGRLELYDANGKRVYDREDEGVGKDRDFDYVLKKAVTGVRKVRFTSLKDEGDQNGYNDIGLGELQIE